MNGQMTGLLEKLFSPSSSPCHLYSKGNTLEGLKINTVGWAAEYLFGANFQDSSLKTLGSILQRLP